MAFRIVADSSSNLYHLEGTDYKYVPLKIRCEEAEFVDDENLDVALMNEALNATKGPSTSSCPNVYEWMEAFGDKEEVFAITITSNLSGSCAAAKSAADEYMTQHPGRKVHVVDSLSTGGEMCLLIHKIVECDKAGMTFEETVEAVGDYAKHTRLVFSLKSLSNLAKNGRVSGAKAKIAGVLGIRVVGKASDVGTLEPLHNCRGEKKSINTLLEVMEETGYEGGKVIIGHCFNEETAGSVAKLIRENYPQAEVSFQKTGGLCSFYAEEGGLIIGYEIA